MKQVLQNIKDGKTTVSEVPIPHAKPGTALIQNAVSLVSAGTERMIVDFASKNIIGKAKSRPDLVKQVIEKAQREGLLSTFEAAMNRLDQPMSLGYSSAGTVIEVGDGLTGIIVGDRVACSGSGYAVHAEYAVVPKNLITPLPDNVSFEQAAFTTIGAIAMHGFRLAEPQLGENVAIIGLGLLGILSASIAKAAGCNVLGIDVNKDRLKLTQNLDIKACLRESAVDKGNSFTNAQGFDHVLICADTTSDDPIDLAAQLARDRANIVAVGAIGLNIPRKYYYEKELNVIVSRSYGPGRYDANYEEAGIDYPPGYVRWTEGRNFSSFVQLLHTHAIEVNPLITHRFDIEEAPKAYELVSNETGEPYLGVLLTYTASMSDTYKGAPDYVVNNNFNNIDSDLNIGVIGAGNYANATFLPAMKKVGKVNRIGVASSSGLSASHAAIKYNFRYATSSENKIFEDPDINIVVLLTRHNLHTVQIINAFEHGKHVYCEKPLAMTQSELDSIKSILSKPYNPLLMVGFNRRFAPFSKLIKEELNNHNEPMVINYRINAGYLPRNHWLNDPVIGGGRIIGEACHFIDYLCFLAEATPSEVTTKSIPNKGKYHDDNTNIMLTFPDGSIGTISYLANGNKRFPKERVEIFCDGKICILDDFRQLNVITENKNTKHRSWLTQDKGHRSAWQSFIESINTTDKPPIPYNELISVTETSFAAVRSLKENQTIKL